MTETHLDSSFEDDELMVYGYKLFRRDRNKNGSGVAFYVLDHIPVEVRYDLSSCNVELLWVQVHLPHLKPILAGCCHRPLVPTFNIWVRFEICLMQFMMKTEKYLS